MSDMGINDFGSLNDPLGNPQLGGPQGWAASVRDAVVSLQSGAARSYAGTVRSTEGHGDTGVWVPLSGEVSISNAPQGLYLVAATGSCSRVAVAGTPLQMRVTFGGQAQPELTIAEVNDDYTRPAVYVALFPWTGSGTLRVLVEVRAVIAPVSVKTGSRVAVGRVSV